MAKSQRVQKARKNSAPRSIRVEVGVVALRQTVSRIKQKREVRPRRPEATVTTVPGSNISVGQVRKGKCSKCKKGTFVIDVYEGRGLNETSDTVLVLICLYECVDTDAGSDEGPGKGESVEEELEENAGI